MDKACELARLEEELDQLVKALPAHGLKPALLQRIEELEERVAELKAAPGRVAGRVENQEGGRDG